MDKTGEKNTDPVGSDQATNHYPSGHLSRPTLVVSDQARPHTAPLPPARFLDPNSRLYETRAPSGLRVNHPRMSVSWVLPSPLPPGYPQGVRPVTCGQMPSQLSPRPFALGPQLASTVQPAPLPYVAKPYLQPSPYLQEQPPRPLRLMHSMVEPIHSIPNFGPVMRPVAPNSSIPDGRLTGKTRVRNFETVDIPKKKKSRRICVETGCKKYAQGATKRCVRHGGGRRCHFKGCTKSAAGSTPYCIAHGGGKRCEKEGCSKSAISPANLCFAHGGGKRCQVPGCSKSGRGAASLCIVHSESKQKTS